jgi:hypothetical protein
VIDGDPAQRNARYLLTVFQPGERVQTGIRPTVHDVAFLRDATAESLAGFESIFLLDVPRLDERPRRNLGEYVRSGGGLAVFLGPDTSLAAYNEWHAADSAVFPAELERIDRLGTSTNQATDLLVTDHLLFRALQGDSNPLLRNIRIDQYVRMKLTPDLARNTQSQVIARTRSGQPFVVDSRVGAGRVVVVASSLAPIWNNWATQPTFVVFLLELQSYLDSQRALAGDLTVGAEPSISIPVEGYRGQANLSLRPLSEAIAAESATVPADSRTEPTDVPDATAPTASQQDGPRRPAPISLDVQMPIQTEAGKPVYAIDWVNLVNQRPALEQSGILSIEFQRATGATESKRVAVNVAPEEGELAIVADQELWPDDASQGVVDSDVRILRSGDLRAEELQPAGFNWAETILVVVCVLLLLEQVLAYLLSYHPAPSRRFA